MWSTREDSGNFPFLDLVLIITLYLLCDDSLIYILLIFYIYITLEHESSLKNFKPQKKIFLSLLSPVESGSLLVMNKHAVACDVYTVPKTI